MRLNRRGFLSLTGISGVSGMRSLRSRLAGKRPAWPPSASLDDDAFWAQVRAQFPLTHDRVYLNTGGLGPAPFAVIDKVQQTMMDLQRISEHGHKMINASRVPVAAFFGVQPEEIAFMRNATEGNATIASGLRRLQPGDEVILETHAHPGGAIPWMNRQKQEGIVVKAFEPDSKSADENLNRIEALITPRTRAIQVSHVTAPTGIVMPVKQIAKLAHDRGLWFHIDGAQSAGAFPFNLREIDCDSYATSGHKWMCATHGTGLLYIKQDRLDEVAPTEAGSYTDNGTFDIPSELEYNESAVRYECGTRDAPSVVGMVEAVGFLENIGMDKVAAYGKKLAAHLRSNLSAIDGVTVLTPSDPTMTAGITTFATTRMPYLDLYRSLANDHKLRCRIVSERGLNAIRISTHIFNNQAECDRLIRAVQTILK